METSCRLYFKHPSAEIQQQLKSLLTAKHDETSLAAACQQINPALGAKAAAEFFSGYGQSTMDADEGVEHVAGFTLMYWTHGSSGDEMMLALVKLLYALTPDITAKAFGSGDDDPWEFWVLQHNGKVFVFDNGAFEDDEADAEVLGTVYRLWHHDMPEDIRPGWLMDEDSGDFIEVDEELRISDEDYQAWCNSLGTDTPFTFPSRDYDDDEDDDDEDE